MEISLKPTPNLHKILLLQRTARPVDALRKCTSYGGGLRAFGWVFIPDLHRGALQT